jgi:DNA-binding NarL/FixJ family response regulator
VRITTIAILEDDQMLRSTIVDHLTFIGNYTLVYSGDSINQFLEEKIDADVDIVLLDVHLFNTNSLHFINLILKKHPHSNIIIITGDKSDDLILEGIEEGAKGYLIKPFSILQLNDIILTVLNNGSYLQPIVQNKLLQKLNAHKSIDQLRRKHRLTKRELDIFTNIKQGYSYKEISDKLGISYHTVNHHIKNLYFKLNVSSKGQLLSKYS